MRTTVHPTKLELVQISTAYGQQQEGSEIVTRSKYVEIGPEKSDSPEVDCGICSVGS